MAKNIYIETGDLSSRLLKDTEKNLQSASNKLKNISSTPVYCSPTGYTAIYPENMISEIIRLKRAVDAAINKTQHYARILSTAPEAIAEIDASQKGEITTWLERTGYRYDNSAFGKAMAPIGDLAVDVYHDTVSGVKGIYDIITEKAEYGSNVVQAKINQLVTDLKESYEQHGAVYDVVEYGKCILKGAGAIAKLVVGSIEIATGAGIPMGIMNILSGINSINNVAADLTYLSCDAYELVGTTNWLEDKLVENGAQIGEYFGDTEAGETVGKLIYTGFEAVTFLDSADSLLKDYGKVNTLVTGSTGYSYCWGWTSFDDIMDESSAKIAWEAIKGTKDIMFDAWEFGETLIKIN